MLRNEKDQFQIEYTNINCRQDSFKYNLEFKQSWRYSKYYVTHGVQITKYTKKTSADSQFYTNNSCVCKPRSSGVGDLKAASLLELQSGGVGSLMNKT